MPTVRPFNAITFDPAAVGDLSAVTCPPYDVISDDDRSVLYDRHPYNVVRIVSGRTSPGDTPSDDRYSRACGFFRSWMWEGILREAAQPGLYPYRQAFDDRSGAPREVWGLLGTISLDDEILAHERTMAGPKADRLALMHAVPANLSPIYAIYKEPSGSVSAALPRAADGPALADVTDDQGVRHTVWEITDRAELERVAEALAPSPVLIADGHHRFETAKRYRDERRAADGPGRWDAVMTLLVDAGVQPVSILPYHRIIRECPGEIDEVLAARFDVEILGSARDVDAAEMEARLWADPRADAFVIFTSDRALLARARTPDPDAIPAGVLHRELLAPLGITSAEASLSFTPDAARVRDDVVSGQARYGALIAPVGVDRVWETAVAEGAMPEKSTYFAPKPRDGIVIRALEPCGPPEP